MESRACLALVRQENAGGFAAVPGNHVSVFDAPTSSTRLCQANTGQTFLDAGLAAIAARILFRHSLNLRSIAVFVRPGPYACKIGEGDRMLKPPHRDLYVILNLTSSICHRFRNARG